MYSVFEDLMKQRGLKISDVSKATGVPYSAFTDWRAGRYHPKDDKIKKIADFFGVTADYIRTGDVQTLVPSEGYHLDEQSEGLIEMVMKRPELREFIEEAADADPEDVRTALGVLISLKRKGK